MCRAVVLLIKPTVCLLCRCRRCCGVYNGNFTLHHRHLGNYRTCNTTFKYIGFALKLITTFQQLFTRLCKMSVQTCFCELSWKFHIAESSERKTWKNKISMLSQEKITDNISHFWIFQGIQKNTHENPKFGRVRQVPTRELGWELPGWDSSLFAKFGIFMGIL